MRCLLRRRVIIGSLCTSCRLYQYPNGNVDDVMQMLQTVSEKQKRKLRWCMDTKNIFYVEVFDRHTQRWLAPPTCFTTDHLIKEEDIDRQVESVVASGAADPQQRRPPDETAQQPTVIDFTMQPDVVHVAKTQLRERFPNLRLQLVHTSGKDLQSRLTHTVSVSLVRSRGGAAAAAAGGDGALSSAEKAALQQFEAEALGPGFLRTARRALEEAFEKCGLVFAADAVAESSKSILGSYVELLRRSAPQEAVTVLVAHKGGKAAVQVKVGTKLCSSVTCEECSVTLAKLLEAVRCAATARCPREAQQLAAAVEAHPLILVLPKQHIRVKRLLRKLLHYYYNLAEDGVVFATNHNVQGVFTSSVEVEWPLLLLGLQGVTEKVTLASASGLSRSAAEQLAAVLALKAHFPKEYVEQISFHSEVAEILQSRKASARPDFPPPASKGLKNLLDWALCRRSSVQVKLTPLLLQANKKYESLGVQPTANIWCTTVDVRVKDSNAKTLVVYDQKKNKCENKAIALTLASYFSDLCPDGIAFAKEKGFLTETGGSPPCTAFVPLNDSGAAVAEDERIAALQVVPWQTVEFPPEKGVPLLEKLRRAVTTSRGSDDATALPPPEERVLYDAVKGVFVASLVQQSAGEEKVVCAFSHSNELRCLLSLYLSFAKEQDALTKELVYDVPFALPASAPLDTMVTLVGRLYGLQVAVRLTTAADADCHVELWGVPKAEGEGARRWVLGKAKGASLRSAVRSCCLECFEVHVRHLHPPFGGTPCGAATDVTLAIHAESALAKLMRHFQDEIRQTAKEENIYIEVKLTANRALTVPYTLHMSAVSSTHSIVLETCSGSKLLLLLEELRRNIAAEAEEKCLTGPSALIAGEAKNSSVVERLKTRCEKRCGLVLTVETLFYDKKWVSRLSVQLNDTHSYALCVSESRNKKQSVDNACLRILSTFFGEPLHSVLVDDASVHDCNYLYVHPPREEIEQVLCEKQEVEASSLV